MCAASAAPAAPDNPAPPSTGGNDVRHAQDWIRALLKFGASRGTVNLSDPLIECATKLTRPDKTTLTADEEISLWKCLNKLTVELKTTAEAVQIVAEMERDVQQRPSMFRRYWRDPVGRGQIARTKLWLLVVLLFIIALQVYTLILSSILSDMASAEKARMQVVTQIQDFEAATPEGGQSQKVANLQTQLGEAQRSLEAGYVRLRKWSWPWNCLFIIAPDEKIVSAVPAAPVACWRWHESLGGLDGGCWDYDGYEGRS